MDPQLARDFVRDLLTAQEAVKSGVSAGRAKGYDTAWDLWEKFCDKLAVDPFLEESEDKVEYLQIFAVQLREGKIAPQGNPLRARSVEDYVRGVAQTFLGLGHPDPRLNSDRKMDFRIKRLWKAWGKEDPPPHRVKPIPLSVIRKIAESAHNGPSERRQAIADMIVIAFFFLLRPGEYTYGGRGRSRSQPFRLKDVQFFQGTRRIDLTTCSELELQLASFSTLEFDDQKNSVRGEVIGLGQSGDLLICPVKALLRRVLYLRRHGADPDTPLATLFQDTARGVSAQMITKEIREAVRVLGPENLGFNPSDVTARCLHAAGANALLLSGVDGDIIRLIGRWRSDEMLRYLHVQAAPLMAHYSARMLLSSNYRMIPNQEVPSN